MTELLGKITVDLAAVLYLHVKNPQNLTQKGMNVRRAHMQMQTEMNVKRFQSVMWRGMNTEKLQNLTQNGKTAGDPPTDQVLENGVHQGVGEDQCLEAENRRMQGNQEW
jgi:hypothetical protein